MMFKSIPVFRFNNFHSIKEIIKIKEKNNKIA